MPRYLVKLADDAYVEWSTVVDAPVSSVMTRADVLLDDPARVMRCDANGHSATWFEPQTVEQLVAGNRAGDGETELSVEEIIEQYTQD